MSEPVEGARLCGSGRYELTMPSRFCAHRPCGDCRRAHGAAFVTYAGFKREQVEISGTENLAQAVT